MPNHSIGLRNYAGPTLDALFSEIDARMDHLETELASIARPSGTVANQAGAFTASTPGLTHPGHPINAPADDPTTEAGLGMEAVGTVALALGILIGTIGTSLSEVVSGSLGVADGPAHGTFVDATPTDPAPDGDGHQFNSMDTDHGPGHTDPSADFLDDFVLGWESKKD